MFGVKFRPLDFSSVLGLEDTKYILSKYLEKNFYSSGYIFSGDYSTGKTTLGRIFARSILCENRKNDMSPCNECPSCRSFLQDRNPGYVEIDAANNASKEQIKDLIKSLVYESVSGYKIILFDESQNISKEGNDALLELLERDNKNVILLFCTTEVEKMRPALRSRCTEINVVKPSEKLIYSKLENICKKIDLEYDPEALNLIVQSSGQHYRNAENTLETVSLLGKINIENVKKYVTIDNENISDMLITLSYDLSEAIKICDYLITKINIKSIYENIIKLLNDAIKCGKGYNFEDSYYQKIVKNLYQQYGESLFEILDYIVSKNKFSESILLQSDIIIIHYKMLKSQFEVKTNSLQSNKRENKGNANLESKSTVAAINQLPSWKKENEIRKIKAQKLGMHKDETVPESVSKKWDVEEKIKTPSTPIRKEITPEEFKKVLGGVLDEERV